MVGVDAAGAAGLWLRVVVVLTSSNGSSRVSVPQQQASIDQQRERLTRSISPFKPTSYAAAAAAAAPHSKRIDSYHFDSSRITSSSLRVQRYTELTATELTQWTSHFSAAVLRAAVGSTSTCEPSSVACLSAGMPTPTTDSTAPSPLGPSGVSSPPCFTTLLSSNPSLPLPDLVDLHLHALHAYLSSFTYNSTPGPEHTPHIQAIKSQPPRHIAHTARQIIQRHQPIRCLEAVVVALHLLAATETDVAERSPAGMRLLRYPLRLYSTCGGHHYWHILLVVALVPTVPLSPSASSSSVVPPPVFGAVSISRHEPLSLRPLMFGSLSSLCSSLRDEYGRIGHSLLQMTVGLPATLNERSKAALDWHFLALQLPASKQLHHDSSHASSASQQQQLPSLASAADTDELSAGDGAEEMTTTSPSSTAAALLVDTAAVAREWRRVCDVLDRYAVRAVEYAAQMAHNRQRPAQARPLTPLHPQCHFDPRTQQIKYDGAVVSRRERSRALSTKASRAAGVQREAGKAAGGRVERSGSVASERIILPPLQRRHTLPAKRTADRSAFAV